MSRPEYIDSALLRRAWDYQEKLEKKAEDWRIRRSKRRKAKRKEIPLPDLVSMRKGRFWLFIAALTCLVPGVINIWTGWFDYEPNCLTQWGMEIPYCTSTRPWYAGLEVYGWFFFLMIIVYVGVFDYCIYKRFGKDESWVEYPQSSDPYLVRLIIIAILVSVYAVGTIWSFFL